MGAGAFKFIKRVYEIPFIVSVLVKSFTCPLRKALKVLIVRLIAAIIVSKFSAYN